MSDIVERLRKGGPCIEAAGCDGGGPCKVMNASSGCACAEAADEIARLRNELHIVEVWSARIIAGTQQDNIEIARLTARVRELEGLAKNYLSAAAQVGECGDGNCVVLRPTGMHTNGGCRCTHDMDRARERGVARLLGMAQHIARAAITQEKRDD